MFNNTPLDVMLIWLKICKEWDTMDDLRVQEEDNDQIKSFGQMNLCTIQITNDETQVIELDSHVRLLKFNAFKMFTDWIRRSCQKFTN